MHPTADDYNLLGRCERFYFEQDKREAEDCFVDDFSGITKVMVL